MREFGEILVQSYQSFFVKIASFLPAVLGALVLLIFGWIIAKIIRSISIKLLNLMRLNVVTEKAGIDKFLAEGGVKSTTVQIIGSLFYWLIMFIVILTALNSLGLSVASELFNQIFLFIPNIIVALLVLIFGFFLANIVSQFLVTYFRNVEIENADSLGNIAKYSIMIFVVTISLTQLNIGGELLTNAFLILMSAVCLALAIAFGLGGKDWAGEVLNKYFKK
jgi:hypothetical protein